jgi:light-independent protochlorophyllide reductase subunit B
MFRDDFEFHDEAGTVASGHGSAGAHRRRRPLKRGQPSPMPPDAGMLPRPEPLTNDPCLGQRCRAGTAKIPFFVRGKARRNTERFAAENGLATITMETLYDAKAHFGR